MIAIYIYLLVAIYTPQYKWLVAELPKVNRTETPWLIVVMHSPLYSTYLHHYMEGETMRVVYEKYFVQYKVDVVFSGHVHAYERTVSSFHKLEVAKWTGWAGWVLLVWWGLVDLKHILPRILFLLINNKCFKFDYNSILFQQ